MLNFTLKTETFAPVLNTPHAHASCQVRFAVLWCWTTFYLCIQNTQKREAFPQSVLFCGKSSPTEEGKLVSPLSAAAKRGCSKGAIGLGVRRCVEALSLGLKHTRWRHTDLTGSQMGDRSEEQL